MELRPIKMKKTKTKNSSSQVANHSTGVSHIMQPHSQGLSSYRPLERTLGTRLHIMNIMTIRTLVVRG